MNKNKKQKKTYVNKNERPQIIHMYTLNFGIGTDVHQFTPDIVMNVYINAVTTPYNNNN